MFNSETSSQTNHKIWLERYPADVPAEINPERYRLLIELFEHSVLRYGENTAYLNLGTALSFQDLDRQSRDFAACL